MTENFTKIGKDTMSEAVVDFGIRNLPALRRILAEILQVGHGRGNAPPSMFQSSGMTPRLAEVHF